MRPARRRTWIVGDRFRFNRWSTHGGIVQEGTVFVITGNSAKGVRFRSPIYDAPADRDRRMPRAQFYREVARRLLVRVWEE